MSEAPARLWIDPEYIEDENDCVSRVKIMHRDVEYIRADLVDGLVEAVEKVLRISDRNHDAWYAARAALAKVRGESDD